MGGSARGRPFASALSRPAMKSAGTGYANSFANKRLACALHRSGNLGFFDVPGAVRRSGGRSRHPCAAGLCPLCDLSGRDRLLPALQPRAAAAGHRLAGRGVWRARVAGGSVWRARGESDPFLSRAGAGRQACLPGAGFLSADRFRLACVSHRTRNRFAARDSLSAVSFGANRRDRVFLFLQSRPGVDLDANALVSLRIRLCHAAGAPGAALAGALPCRCAVSRDSSQRADRGLVRLGAGGLVPGFPVRSAVLRHGRPAGVHRHGRRIAFDGVPRRSHRAAGAAGAERRAAGAGRALRHRHARCRSLQKIQRYIRA
ncbi:MAG: hypothetical protein BWZ10_03183 [candidate division BRC1 bacterium ADurb.BinA364]|nr:MAG: hypothetical protein BWZ10_03183 [candidate division BRC1 bacterium ADurb.BinA364]